MRSERGDFWSFITSIGVLVALLALVVTGAPPANAGPKKLKLSPTGAANSYADNLTEPLFEGTFAAGDASEDFWLLNNSSQMARATLTLVEKADPNDLEEHLSFSAAVDDGSPSPQVSLVDVGQCQSIVTGPTIEAGAEQKFDVTMHMADAAPMNHTDPAATFEFVVTLSQVTKKGKVNACGRQPPGSVSQAIQVMGAETSASTAKQVPATPLSAERGAGTVLGWTAFGVLLAGLLLAARQRRRLSRS